MTDYFNTGNPVPSADKRDFSDNCQNLDKALNLLDPTWSDRRGVVRQSFAGMEQQFAAFLQGSAYEVPVDYAPGLSITRPTQTVVYMGVLYRPAVGVLPFTTTTFPADAANWVVQGDASLRQDLASLGGAELVALPTGTVQDGIQFTTPRMFGATGVGDDSAPLNAAFSSGKVVFLQEDFKFTNITIPAGARIIGPGQLIGFTALGTPPDIVALEVTTTPAQRLALLQAYTPNTVTFTGASNMRFDLRISNALLLSASPMLVFGVVELTSCSTYQTCLRAMHRGHIKSDNLISTDSSDEGLRCSYGGTIWSPTCIVYKSTLRGMYVYGGGTINAFGGKVYRSNNDGVAVNQGGTIDLDFGESCFNNNNNCTVTYSGSITINGGKANGSANSAGLSAESSGTIFAQGCQVKDNALWSLVTSFGGFIQAKLSTITGNGRAVETLNGGEINILGATIDLTNNGGGIQIRARGKGYITSERAGGPGKSALSEASYSPPYGIIGNGLAMIYDHETAFVPYPGGDIGISNQQDVISNRKTVLASAVVAGVLTISSKWVLVDNTLGSVTIHTIVRSAGFLCDELTIQGVSSTNTVTVSKTGGTNRFNGADVVLANGNSTVRMTRLANFSPERWTIPNY